MKRVETRIEVDGIDLTVNLEMSEGASPQAVRQAVEASHHSVSEAACLLLGEDMGG